MIPILTCRQIINSKFCYLFLLFFCLSFCLFLASCSKDEQVVDNDGWEQRVSEIKPDISFPYLDEWELLNETYRNGILSLQLEQQDNSSTIELVITVLPVILTADAMFSEAEKMLEASLYQVRQIRRADENYEGRAHVVIVDAIAGERETIFVRTAGLARDGRTYYFTVLAREESFEKAVDGLDKILSLKIPDPNLEY